jgi:predicted kinase
MLLQGHKHANEGNVQHLLSSLRIPSHYSFWYDSSSQDEVVDAKLLFTLRRGVEAYHGQVAVQAYDHMVSNLRIASMENVREGLYALEDNHWERATDDHRWAFQFDEEDVSLPAIHCSAPIDMVCISRIQHAHEATATVLDHFFQLVQSPHPKPTPQNWMVWPNSPRMAVHA